MMFFEFRGCALSGFSNQGKLKAFRRPKPRATCFVSLMGAIHYHPNFFEGDEPATQHFVKFGEDLLDPVRVLDNLENNGEVLGKTQ